jgi:LPXTG-motif cell wall-anchored protein
MSQYRHNSYRRAIRTQAGGEAYPYAHYSPVAYSPNKIGYAGAFNGYGAPYGGWFGKAAKGVGGFFKEILPEAAKIGGGILGTKMEGQTLENIAQANADAATEQARINAEANTKMAEMQFKFGNTSVGIWTIVGIVGGVALLGGLTFFVLRKRKK